MKKLIIDLCVRLENMPLWLKFVLGFVPVFAVILSQFIVPYTITQIENGKQITDLNYNTTSLNSSNSKTSNDVVPIQSPSNTGSINNADTSTVNPNSRLVYTSWVPQKKGSWLWGRSNIDSLDFDEDTFTVFDKWGVVTSGTYSVHGNTVTFRALLLTSTPVLRGTLSGGRLIISEYGKETVVLLRQ